MAKLGSYRELDVWQKSLDLIEASYRLSARFPADERFGLTAQIRRSAVSVAANIAEGAGRDGNREYVRFLSIASGSLVETDAHLLVSHRLGITDEDEIRPLQQQIDDIGRMLTVLKRSLRGH